MDSSKFPFEIFPREFQTFITHLKSVSGFDTNLSSLAFLSASATSIGNAVKINNGKYFAKPILWCVLVGDSGTRKSHIMKKPFDFLDTRDKEEMIHFQEAIGKAETDSPPPPAKTTILLNATMEAISKVHQDNPRGIILFKDEIIGMLKDFNKYNKGGGDKQELMELFNGNSLKVHRATRDTIYLPETCVNIIGGIQPDRIKYLMNEENLADGFFYRLLLSRVNEYKPLTYNSESINQAIQDSSNLIFESLYNYGETELKVSKEVDLIYKDWFDSSQVNCFNDPFSKALQSKLETYVWRFCIILDVLDQVSNDSRRTEIKAETMDKAIRLAEYFRKESTEIYQESFSEGVLESQPQEFQRIYRKLENREYKTSELYSLLSELWTPDNVNKKLSIPELFTKVRHGHYIKTIKDVKK